MVKTDLKISLTIVLSFMSTPPAQRIWSTNGIYSGWENIVADALSWLPTEEVFLFKEDAIFPLNLAHLAPNQLTNDYLQLALQQRPPDYIISIQEGNNIYVCKETEVIYVPASLREALLQWYCTSLQYPGIQTYASHCKGEFLLARHRHSCRCCRPSMQSLSAVQNHRCKKNMGKSLCLLTNSSKNTTVNTYVLSDNSTVLFKGTELLKHLHLVPASIGKVMLGFTANKIDHHSARSRAAMAMYLAGSQSSPSYSWGDVLAMLSYATLGNRWRNSAEE